MINEKELGEKITRNAQYLWPAAVAFCDYFIFANSMVLISVTAIMLAALFFLRRWDWKVLAGYGVLLILLGLFQQASLSSRFAEYGYWFLASGIMAAMAGTWRDARADRWLRKGPALEEVVSERIDRRKGRKETAIVITTFRNSELLGEHLKALERQTLLDFDIIIVYGEGDRIVESRSLSILHVREKGRGGCSGAYYIGEKTALAEGYKIIILADDDCIPASDDLVQRVTEMVRSGNRIVLPVLDKKGRGIRRTRIPHYYGTFSHEVLEKTGLTYLPLFFGGDDVELMHRIEEAGYKAVYSNSTVTHPDITPFFLDASTKRYYYTRGEFQVLILRGSLAGPVLFSSLHLVAAWALVAIGRKDVGLRILKGLLDGAAMRFFQNKSLVPEETREKEAGSGWDVVFEPKEGQRYVSPNMLLHKGGGAWMLFINLALQMLGTIALLPRYFGKSVLIRKMNPALSLILMLGAKSAFVEFDGKVFRVFEGRSTITTAFGIIFVALAILPSLVLSVLLSAAGHLNRLRKGADSRAYGL